jgi:hypothetical protein
MIAFSNIGWAEHLSKLNDFFYASTKNPNNLIYCLFLNRALRLKKISWNLGLVLRKLHWKLKKQFKVLRGMFALRTHNKFTPLHSRNYIRISNHTFDNTVALLNCETFSLNYVIVRPAIVYGPGDVLGISTIQLSMTSPSSLLYSFFDLSLFVKRHVWSLGPSTRRVARKWKCCGLRTWKLTQCMCVMCAKLFGFSLHTAIQDRSLISLTATTLVI